jgi:DNA methyltransferase 1-associated protein 1
MTSSDVRDVLNLPDGLSAPRPSKKQKTGAARPNLKGLAREVQNLGGDNPIAIVPEVSAFKKKRLQNRKPAAKWEMRPFTNSARDDPSLVLKHWRRKTEDEEGGAPIPPPSQAEEQDMEMTDAGDGQQAAEPAVEDSAFAKYNVKVVVPQYNEDQYMANLQSGDWTKEETDYLLELVKDFDIRWPIIWDRYAYVPKAINGEAAADGDEVKAIIPASKPRTMEDLKARYYEVASKMMVVQKPAQYMTAPEFALHEMMANFNPGQEKLRKEFASNALTRSREEAKEEESLLLEIKRLLARQDRFNEDRRELYNRLDYPHTDQDISGFKSSQGLHALLQTLANVDRSKKRRSLMDAQGISPSGPNGPQSAVSETSNRRESIAASLAGGHRDSIGGTAQTPTTASGKKGAQQLERRKLTEAEEFVYGVSHHDRLSSGPTFRYEKINKLFTHKSNQQQLRITNTLSELDVPPRLVMPTAAMTSQYEQLLGAVNSLLDSRKLSDKLDAEMKVELAKKEEWEKANPPPETATTESESKPADETAQTTAGTTEDSTKPTESTATETATEDKATAAAPEASTQPAEATAASVEPKDEAAGGDKDNKAARPESRGASHKRSASVLSTVSDKSAKRQKK